MRARARARLCFQVRNAIPRVFTARAGQKDRITAREVIPLGLTLTVLLVLIHLGVLSRPQNRVNFLLFLLFTQSLNYAVLSSAAGGVAVRSPATAVAFTVLRGVPDLRPTSAWSVSLPPSRTAHPPPPN